MCMIVLVMHVDILVRAEVDVETCCSIVSTYCLYVFCFFFLSQH